MDLCWVGGTVVAKVFISVPDLDGYEEWRHCRSGGVVVVLDPSLLSTAFEYPMMDSLLVEMDSKVMTTHILLNDSVVGMGWRHKSIVPGNGGVVLNCDVVIGGDEVD